MQGNIYLLYFILLYSAMKVPAGQAPAPDFYRISYILGME